MTKFSTWDARKVLPAITVEPLGGDRFISIAGQRNTYNGVFGGQFMGLALQAASLTVEEKAVHAIAGFFLRKGDYTKPLDFAVDRPFDGKTFAARRVTCRQAGQVMFHLEASFQADEAGISHGAAMPQVPPPENLVCLQDLMPGFLDRVSPKAGQRLTIPRAIDLRPTDPQQYIVGQPDGFRRRAWLRLPTAAGLPDHSQRSLLAYATDYVLAGTAVLPHEMPDCSSCYFMASLNQSMWFYRPVKTDEWLLCDCETPAVSNGRGTGRVDIYDRAGVLLASATQEALIRESR